MVIYFIDELLNSDDKNIFQNIIKKNHEINLKKVIYINAEKCNITQFVTTAIRWCGKLDSKRLMILPIDFQRQAIQLNIAKHNKQIYQVFEATTAKLFDVWRYMFCETGQNSEIQNNLDLSDLVDIYRKSLQASGLFDHFSISDILKKDLLDKGKIYEKLQNLILIVEDIDLFSAIDLRLLKIVCEHFESKRVVTSNANRSLDISGIGELLESSEIDTPPQVSFQITEMKTEELFQNLYEDSNIFKPREKETNKRRIEQIFICHIRLLINSKDEFALALILNLPGRDITPTIFAKIKKAAAEKNIPIYQAIMSTVIRHRLGSKGYQPNKDCPIVQYLKPLSQFVDFMMKLQDLIEEETEPKKCALKILSKIKTVSGGSVKAHQLQHSYSEIQEYLKETMESDWDDFWGQADEKETTSCAVQTLKSNSGYNFTLKALQNLCDAEAGKNTHFFINNYDFNSDCPENTPNSHIKGSPQLELPSLVHLYKSPSSPAVEKDPIFGEDSAPLIDRLQKGNSATNNKPKAEPTRRLQSHLDWVGEVSPMSNKSPITPGRFSSIIGPTLQVTGINNEKSKPVSDWKDTLEEINENREARLAEEDNAPTNKRKRALIKDISNLPVESKKTKPNPLVAKGSMETKANLLVAKGSKETKTKLKKNVKQVKQVKGQQSITKFFS